MDKNKKLSHSQLWDMTEQYKVYKTLCIPPSVKAITWILSIIQQLYSDKTFPFSIFGKEVAYNWKNEKKKKKYKSKGLNSTKGEVPNYNEVSETPKLQLL